jgi:ankyrin repeat protein
VEKDANNQLLMAAQENDTRKMKLALKNGADVNVRTESGQTVLHFVQDEQLAKLLIEKGANVNLKEYDFEMTPIFFHDVAIAKILYKAGADINIKAKKGITPLMWYGYNNYPDGVRFLIANGAHINLVNGEDSTALDIAIRFEYAELVEYLRSVGAKTAAELRQ